MKNIQQYLNSHESETIILYGHRVTAKDVIAMFRVVQRWHNQLTVRLWASVAANVLMLAMYWL